ncbi:MAG: DUF7009 family protein [Terriglobales bacterium]
MKLRIQGNAIRLRLNRKEVAELAAAGQILESVEFSSAGDQRLAYAIEVDAKLSAVAADYQRGRITIRLPRSLAREWLETEQIGVKGEQPLGSGGVLRILIEKDFQCLHTEDGRVENEVDPEAYPNPLADANRQEAC